MADDQMIDPTPTAAVRHRRQSTPSGGGRLLPPQQRPPLRPTPKSLTECDWKGDENVKPPLRTESSIDVDQPSRSGMMQRMASEHLQQSGRKQSFSSATNSGNSVHVKVVLRCRPFNADEQRAGLSESILECRENSKEVVCVTGRRAEGTKGYTFDGVCGPTTSQQRLFETHVVPLVDEVLQGFNCTIFAYGQTGTGKTFTMEGDWSKDLTSEPPTPTTGSQRSDIVFKLPRGVGVIPRSVALIFERLGAQDLENSLKVSFLEIYNEELIDLLQDGDRLPLRIYDSYTSPIPGGSTKGLAVKNLQEVSVENLPDVYRILSAATKKRRTAETSLNRQSSRSHSIFTITITMKETTAEGEDIIRIGKLNLVDLAGSENISRSGTNNNKDRAKEAGIINQSLVALGRVITALTGPSNFIPYRDSKLTRLLQESLGGRTKTCIIATVSPSPLSADETISTLDYAHRAKHIKNRPEVNQKVTQKFVLKEMSGELEKLRKELVLARERSGDVILTTEMHHELESQVLELQALKKAHSDLRKAHDVTETEMLKAKQCLETLFIEKQNLESITDDLGRLLIDKLHQLVATKKRLGEEQIVREYFLLEDSMFYADAERKKIALVAAGSALLQLLNETEATSRGFTSVLNSQRYLKEQHLDESLTRMIAGVLAETEDTRSVTGKIAEHKKLCLKELEVQVENATEAIGSLGHVDLQNSIREIRTMFEELLERNEDSLTDFGRTAEDSWRLLIGEICGPADTSHLTNIFALFKRLISLQETREETWRRERLLLNDENLRLSHSLHEAEEKIKNIQMHKDAQLSQAIMTKEATTTESLNQMKAYLKNEDDKDAEMLSAMMNALRVLQDEWGQRSSKRLENIEAFSESPSFRFEDLLSAKETIAREAGAEIQARFAEVADVLSGVVCEGQRREKVEEQECSESKRRLHDIMDKVKSDLKLIGGKLVASQNASVSKFTDTRTTLRDASLDVLRASLTAEKSVIGEMAGKTELALQLISGPFLSTCTKSFERLEALLSERVTEILALFDEVASSSAKVASQLQRIDNDWESFRLARFPDALSEDIQSLVGCLYDEPSGYLSNSLTTCGVPLDVSVLRSIASDLGDELGLEEKENVIRKAVEKLEPTKTQKDLLLKAFQCDSPSADPTRMATQESAQGSMVDGEEPSQCLPPCIERLPKLLEAVLSEAALLAALAEDDNFVGEEIKTQMVSQMEMEAEGQRTAEEAHNCIQKLLHSLQDYEQSLQSADEDE